MKKSKSVFYEYGEIGRKPIPKNILFAHWQLHNKTFKISHLYNICYYNGDFVEIVDYSVKQLNTNEFVSKIKIANCIL